PAVGAAQEMLRGRINKVLKTLSYREREIIKLRYGLGDGYSYTLEEVGHIFKVTRERIRQIEAKAVRKLQQPSRSQELAGFLD
ncbi:MAG TPA: sigma-70 family RNA polymerase sigma factor, partial [Pirellulales bacterium]